MIRREIEKQLKVAIGNALTQGERFLSVAIVEAPAVLRCGGIPGGIRLSGASAGDG